ncbi:MAG: GNAT family N-acetyltransferase [Spirochaetales bacterium]|jgi:GNAT superfamily N-acetyltransferase|nr:GNAT family N-acetyltransferase [Spirochaetales bacterium]
MIRKATAKDAAEIARIQVSSWQAAYSGIVPQSHLDSMSIKERAKRWAQNIKKPGDKILVADIAESLEGFIFFGPSCDEDADGEHEIGAVYIQPQAWRQGIGKELVKRAEEIMFCRFAADITLWVFEENHSSRKFYTSVGYSPDGATKEMTIGGALLNATRYRKVVNETGKPG